MAKFVIFISTFFYMLVVCVFGVQAQTSVDFASESWNIEAEHSEIVTHMGREALHLRSGSAQLKGVNFTNGTIKVDIAPRNARSFSGLIFRVMSDGDYEEIYIRQHKSGLPDAMQYTPKFNGQSSWQLYPEYQAAVGWDNTKWITLKIEISDTEAKVFLNDSSEPVLTIDDLKLGMQSGSIGVWSLFDSYFSNFSYEEERPFVQGNIDDKDGKSKQGLITSWQLSPAFSAKRYDFEDYPDINKINWKEVTTESSGLLNISKYREKEISTAFEQNSTDFIWLKLELSAVSDMSKKFFFDYSDRTRIYLNGIPMFEGDNSFWAKGLLFRGDVDKELTTNALIFPFRKGKNQIVVRVSEVANGWGFIARLEDLSGLTLLQ